MSNRPCGAAARRPWSARLTASAGLLAAAAALAACAADLPESSGIRAGTSVSAPPAYTEMCRREPALCAMPATAAPPVAMTQARFRELAAVNRAVNAELRYASDRAVFGRHEFWTVPDDAGDCEDFALLKMQRLLDLGYPRRALRMAIAARNDGVLHAVLAVETERGTFILDNNHAEPQPWIEMGYSGWRWESPGRHTWVTDDAIDTPTATASR